jgi:putative transposase
MENNLRILPKVDNTNPGEYLTDFQKKLLLQTLKESDLREEYRCRINIMLLADQGKSQAEICEELGCCQETARYWISRAETGQAHKWNYPPIGRPRKADDSYLQRLQELVFHSPKDFGYSFQTWTAEWLSRHLAKEFAIVYSSRQINRLLKKMGLSCQQRFKQKSAEKTLRGSLITIAPLEPNSSEIMALANLPTS